MKLHSMSGVLYRLRMEWYPRNTRGYGRNYFDGAGGVEDIRLAVFLDSGMSPFVISATKPGSGSKSITWKCSTACTDLRDAQFLNHMT